MLVRVAVLRFPQPRLKQAACYATIRAHDGSSRGAGFTFRSGRPGVIGLRREDKNKWERRAPLAPRHVADLKKQGFKVIVQPSTLRVFTDDDYRDAGAVVQEDLSECSVITAVKEVPIESLLPRRTWCFFSHTIKAQPAGMPLLDAAMEKKVRLVDYEVITENGLRGGKRLVAFGEFAGYAGAVDFLRGLGERFLSLGYNTPLLHISSSFMYPNLEEARRAVGLAGTAIKEGGLPAGLCPLTVVFTGRGNVTTGALDIFKLLPHEVIEPEQLPSLFDGNASRNKLYLIQATSKHMVKHIGGKPFNKETYYSEPELFESIFQDTILPYSTAVVNGMYWDARFPRLFTAKDLHSLVTTGQDKLLGVCDITCDSDGSVPTQHFTSIEQPFVVFNALTGKTSENMDDPGVIFHAVDHLPSELPREASEHFGNCLLPLLPALANDPTPEKPGPISASLPAPIAGAIITQGGELTEKFAFIQSLRDVRECGPLESDDEGDTVRAHSIRAPLVPSCATLEIKAHLFDNRLVNTIADIIESRHARQKILNVDVGENKNSTSSLSMLIMSQTAQRLVDVVSAIEKEVLAVGGKMRRAGGSDAQEDLSGPEEERRHILLLGAGMVSDPAVKYLLRNPLNMLTVASLGREEVDAVVKRHGHRVQPKVIDVSSSAPETLAECDAMVQASDLVMSLLPASLHVGIARLAIKHRKPMVTSSYVSAEMAALDAEARAAETLLINEVGLDPGIDHMSAMKMISDARTEGSRILSFSSVCGGLPAPEAIGSSPLAYKFSWNPKGVLLASQNPARFQRDGALHDVAGKDLLAHVEPLMLNNALVLDVLPNRDSTTFADLYGLAKAPSFFRGTLRYKGFCNRMLALSRVGLLDTERRGELATAVSWKDWVAKLVGSSSTDIRELRDVLEQRMGSDLAEDGVEFMSWLGLLDDAPLPQSTSSDSPIDVLTSLLQRSDMAYQQGERDMVVMRHELVVERANGGRERRESTLIEYGGIDGSTAMAKTVGITAAICAQLVLDGPPGRFGVGVQRPLQPEWYGSVMDKLADEGVRMQERSFVVKSG